MIEHGSICGIVLSAPIAFDHISTMGLLVLWDMLLAEVRFDLNEESRTYPDQLVSVWEF